MNLLNGFFGQSPKLGRPTGSPAPIGSLPSGNNLQNQFNDKIQQIKAIITQLNKKRA